MDADPLVSPGQQFFQKRSVPVVASFPDPRRFWGGAMEPRCAFARCLDTDRETRRSGGTGPPVKIGFHLRCVARADGGSRDPLQLFLGRPVARIPRRPTGTAWSARCRTTRSHA